MRDINPRSIRSTPRPPQPRRTARVIRERTVIRDVVAPSGNIVRTVRAEQVVYLDTITKPALSPMPQPVKPVAPPVSQVPVPQPPHPAVSVQPIKKAHPVEPVPVSETQPKSRRTPVQHTRAIRKKDRSIKVDVEKTSIWQKLRSKRRTIMSGALVAAVLVVTGYVSIDTWLTNNRVKQELTSYAAPADDTGEHRQTGEGRDEKEVPQNTIDNYKVAPNVPRIISIDKLNVKARLMPMGVNTDGSMQAPLNIFDAGWYTGSARLGEAGATVIDAHASGPTREGLFAYLDTLGKGDIITVERGDGELFRYKVVHTETVSLKKVDMNKLMLPYGNQKEGLNLITCTGSWLEGQRTFDHRVLVYTERTQ